MTALFSEHFWAYRVPDGDSFFCTEAGQIDFSSSTHSSDAERAALVRARALMQEIQRGGCVGFVQKSLKQLTIRIDLETFRHNITQLFRRAIPTDTALGDALASEVTDELSHVDLPRDIGYAECCKLATPDVVIDVGGKKFPAHRSMLCYYPYFAKMFEWWMLEARTNQITFPDIDPDDFAPVLEWIYSGKWEWMDVPPIGSDTMDIHDAITLNSARLQNVLWILDRLALLPLLEKGKQLEERLSTVGARPHPASVMFHSQTPAANFSQPASQLFYDVAIAVNGASFKANQFILACRSPYFRDLLEKSENRGVLVIDEPAIAATFFGNWIEALHKGARYSLEKKYISETNAGRLLKIFTQEHAIDAKEFCCQFIIDKNLYSHLSPEEMVLCDFLRLLVFDDTVKQWLKEHGQGIREARLSDRGWVNDEVVAYIVACCPNLQRLDLCRCTGVTDASVYTIARHYPNLQALYLVGCNVSDASIATLAASCPKLRSLFLTGCCHITDASILQVADLCPYLQELALESTGVSPLSISRLAAKCCNLTWLRLSGPPVTDDSLSEIATLCHMLQILDISDSSLVTKRSLIQLSDCSPHLKDVSVSRCPNVDRSFKAYIQVDHPECIVSISEN